MMDLRLAEAPLDLFEEQPQIERFWDPCTGERGGSDPVDELADAAENDAMRPPRAGLLERSQHLAARHMGHFEVGDDEGKQLFVRQAQAFSAIRGERNLEIQPAK